MKRALTAAGGTLALLILLVILLLFRPSVWVLAGIFFILLSMLGSFAANLLLKKRLHVAVMLPATTAKNTVVSGKIAVTNDGFLPVARVICRVSVLNDLTGEETFFETVMGVGARKTAQQSFLFESGYCGRLYVSVKSVTLTDAFGILPMRARVKAAARMTVLPELFPVETGERRFSAEAEDGYAEKKGDDRTEIFALREYRAGDDVRQIHWKLSSKLDELSLKEASLPTNRARLLFWDKKGAPAQIDALADSVASVANALLERGEAFRLCYPERDELIEWEIADETTLLQAIPALARCAASPDCPRPKMEGYGNILYFSAQYNEEFAADERVVQILCTESERDDAVVFTPQTARERLQRLEI